MTQSITYLLGINGPCEKAKVDIIIDITSNIW